MFLRRVFARKDQTESQEKNSNGISRSNTVNHDSPYRLMRRNSIANDEKQQRSLTMIQLTPLWEHIIRMKRLPDNVNEKDMFSEFAERLRDPEWQVRQHALKVLIDVLIVMRERSDQFFEPLVCPLVENLGHSAPAIRKGALDVLKVYMTETEMPETVILEIIDSGMEQKKYFKQFDGRVCVGVMLSLPSLLYTSLGTSKQNHIVRAVIEALTSKMVQVTYQEIALKVLLRIREMIGAREFSEHIAHGAYRDFELLCNVYGLPSTPDTQDPSVDLYKPQNATENSRVWNPSSQVNESNCKVKRTELCWRDKQDEISADDEENNNSVTKQFNCNGINSDNKSCTQSVHVNVMTKKSDNEKIIMETEIKIQDTALTMRILEANSNSSENDVPGEISEDDLSSVYEHNGVVRILTDSELDDSNNTVIEVLDSSRNPLKRVTFGGEEVKLRTPDSDSVLQSDNDDAQKAIQVLPERKTTNELEIKTATLNIDREIADNLLKKPNSSTIRPQTASIIITTSSPPASNDETDKAMKIRHKSASPGRRSRRPSFSSADEAIISPKGAHKGIEVLHNLQQRSPSVSPIRSRQNSLIDNKMNSISDKNINVIDSQDSNKFEDDIIVEEISSPEMNRKLSEPKKSWENLGLVDEVCLRNAKSGVSITIF